MDVMLPLECLAEERLALAAAKAGHGIPPWMTQEETVAHDEAQVAKTEAIVAKYGNCWPDRDTLEFP